MVCAGELAEEAAVNEAERGAVVDAVSVQKHGGFLGKIESEKRYATGSGIRCFIRQGLFMTLATAALAGTDLLLHIGRENCKGGQNAQCFAVTCHQEALHAVRFFFSRQ